MTRRLPGRATALAAFLMIAGSAFAQSDPGATPGTVPPADPTTTGGATETPGGAGNPGATRTMKTDGHAHGTGTAAASGTPTMAAPSEVEYANKAAMGDSYEIQSGELAAEMATSQAVKDLASMIVADHRASSEELARIIANEKIGLDAAQGLDTRHQAMIDALKAATGAAFDKAYLDQQVAAHREALALHQAYSAGGGNNELKRLADKVIPKIQMHLDTATQLGGTTVGAAQP